MPQPAARQNDPVTGIDTHILVVPGAGPTPTPLPYAGQLALALSPDVLVNSLPAATVDSISVQPPHIPPPSTSFTKPPTNQGRVVMGSTTVLVNGKPLARLGDPVATCNDPVDLPVSKIVAGSPDVLVG
ncbi:PAAR domain-containing protein [Paractinoplanes rishiriensis]|uniref:PAAR motif protein n=1 Tax=Paractinoplanes rishiriensis TaxID=1050105 RepID=A0A919JWV3_9ACTN|nr:PAAR domain-containing protein [Actinoplanes rishiriensis]GIE94782.1 PAAR motif protein [Actinoplanes rishiriensis]